jgi:GNAT superfamily N-acetyltransferase
MMQGDMDAVLRLAQMQVEETLPHLDFCRDMAEQAFNETVSGYGTLGLVAEIDGEIVGFLRAEMHGYLFTAGVFVVLDVLYVRPDKRGTRAAAALIRQFVQWGDTVRAREILFGVSSKLNIERTARFFEHFGAERVGYQHRIVRG